jgi:LemA protein
VSQNEDLRDRHAGGDRSFFHDVAQPAMRWLIFVEVAGTKSQRKCGAAFAQIDVQLKRRHDLVPGLVTATHAYLKHERETLTAVTAARQRAVAAQAGSKRKGIGSAALTALEAAESELGGQLGRLMALVESYPELRADDTVSRLTEELSSTENRIAFARQAFNDQVLAYNTVIELFPSSLVATITGFRRAAMMRATRSSAETAPVPVTL